MYAIGVGVLIFNYRNEGFCNNFMMALLYFGVLLVKIHHRVRYLDFHYQNQEYQNTVMRNSIVDVCKLQIAKVG